MTAAQEEALARLSRGEAVRLAAPTARILRDRYGYIEPDADGWKLTPRGQGLIAERQARQRQSSAASRLTTDDREWAERVIAWMKAHKRLSRRAYAAWRYAEHVAACDHAGIDPVPVGGWSQEDLAYVHSTVRAAARVLADFDEQAKIASARGVGLTVEYMPDEKVPRSRREAAREASADAGQVVDLRRYRERRP